MNKSKVLLIDDNEDMILIGSRVFERAGYQFLSSRSGQDGLQVAKSEIPDVIILDYILPDMNGSQLLNKMFDDSELSAISNIPIVVLTARPDYIEELSGTIVTYQILSVEEAPGYSGAELDLNVNYTGDPNAVSGCPDVQGGRDLWCVVLDREITSKAGNNYSHFLVQQLGSSWYVEELSSTESAEFTHFGCKNWDAVLASQE